MTIEASSTSLFDAPDMITRLEAMQPDTLDDLPFGVVALDSSGVITFYNHQEEAIAGLERKDTLGRNFFYDIAPCTNNFMVRARYMNAWRQEQSLDEIIPYTFAYRMKATRVRLRMLVSGERGWLLVALTR